MAIATGLVRAAANTSTGTQDFRDANMTVTPNLAIFTISRATADGAAADHAIIGYGAGASTSQRFACSTQAENGAVTSNANKVFMTDQCICILDTTGAAIDGEADFVQFLSDGGSGAGVQITWGNAPAAAYLVTVKLYKVDNVQVGNYTTGAAAGNTTVVTTNFAADVFYFFTTAQVTADTIDIQAVLSAGVAHYNGTTITQRCAGFLNRDGQATEQLGARCSDARVAMSVSATGTETWGSDLTAVSSTNFTVTQRTGGASQLVGYVAIDLGSRAGWVGTITSPTSTGSQAITAPNFKPQSFDLILTNMEALATAYTDNRTGSFGTSWLTANNRYSITIADEDAALTANAQSYNDDTAVYLPNHDGAAQCTASFTSFDATGMTINHSAVAATGKLWFGIAIEAEAGGAISGTTAGIATVTATLIGTGVLSGLATALASLTAVLSALGQLVGAIAGTATASAILTAVGELIGSSAGVASGTAVLTATGALTAQSDGIATASGALTATGALAGTSNGVATATGDLTEAASGAISGSTAGSASVTGALTASGALVATATGQATTTAILAGSGALAGSSDGVATASGTLAAAGDGQITGVAAGIATTTGSLTATGQLTGVGVGLATVNGELIGLYFIEATAVGLATTNGTLTASGLLMAITAGATTTTGILTASGQLIGSSAGIAVVTGTFTGAAVAVYELEIFERDSILVLPARTAMLVLESRGEL